MAGVKGKSGGPRKNAGGPRRNSGGYRQGAGRKSDPPVHVSDPSLDTDDPDKWLRACMESEHVPMRFRLKAAAYLRSQPIAPMEVMDALYMKAMKGNVTACIAYLRPWMGSRKNRRK